MLGRRALSAAAFLFLSSVAAAACSKADNTDAALANGDGAGAGAGAAGAAGGGGEEQSGAGSAGKSGAGASAGKGGSQAGQGGGAGKAGSSGKGGASGKGGSAGEAAQAGEGGAGGNETAGAAGETDAGSGGGGMAGVSGTGGAGGGGISGWTCGASLYDELAKGVKYPQCNCDCGLYDPDCESPFSYVKGCDKGQTCNKLGVCEGEVAVTPPSWICGSTYYAIGGKAPVCNCGCGAPDPDCHLPTYSSDLTKCGRGQTCAGDGTCTGPILEVPATWTCKPSKFAEGKTSGTCDCDCGAPDPDCADPYLPMTGCGFGQTCEAGVCTGEVKPDPPGWGCAKGTYSDGKICNCECGSVRDPDCDFLYDKLPDDCGPGRFCRSNKNECL
jgi:hypothetical protein